MEPGKAFLSGVAGAAAMSVLMVLGRALGVELSLEMLLGTMLGLAPSLGAFAVGLLMHLAIGGLFALGYALLFERVAFQASARRGARYGLVHAVIAGLAMGLVPLVHPGVPIPMGSPGPFLTRLGLGGVAMLFATHLLFGAVVGGLYARLHSPARPLRS